MPGTSPRADGIASRGVSPPAPSTQSSLLVRGLWLLATYVLTAGGSLLYLRYGTASPILLESSAMPWLAVGVGVAGIMRGGPRLWPALFIGSWIVWGLIARGSPVTVTIDAAAEAASIVLIARWLDAWGYRREFDRIRDPLVLLAAALLGRTLAMLVDDAGGLACAWFAPEWVDAEYRDALFAADGHAPVLKPKLLLDTFLWIADGTAGIMLVVPAALSNRSESWRAVRGKPAAAIIWLASFALLAILALTVPLVWPRMALVIGALLLVIWAAIDFGVFATAVAVLLVTVLSIIRIGLGFYRQAGLAQVDPISLMWGVVTLFAMCGFMTVTLMAERRRDVARLAALAERYRRLFRANPAALLVTDAGDGRIHNANDAALRLFGYREEELCRLTMRQLMVQVRESQPVPAGADVIALPPARHRIAAGGVIDVGLESVPLTVAGARVRLWTAIDVSAQAEMRHRLLEAADRERLAGELHDGLGQVLTGLSLGAQSLVTRSRRLGSVAPEALEFVDMARVQATKQLQTVSAGASPLEAAEGDLRAALRKLPESLPPEMRALLQVVIEEHAPVRVSLERSEHLLRLAQEALHNALKHARAQRIVLRLSVLSDRLQLSIEDDGVGATPSANAARARAGLGLDSMAARASAAGAGLTIGPRPGGGTRVLCDCPQLAPDVATEHGRPVAAADEMPRPFLRWAELRAATPHAARTAAFCLVLAVACAAGLVVTVTLASAIDPALGMAGSQLAVPSLMAGFAAAGLVLGGVRLWPGVFLGVLVAYGAVERLPWSFGALAAAASVCGTLLTVASLRMGRFSRRFDRWQDPLVLLGAASLGWACAESMICMLLLAYTALKPNALGAGFTAPLTGPHGEVSVASTTFLAAALRWWADTTAGVVQSVPAIVATPSLWRAARGQRRELFGWLAATVAWLAALFTVTVVAPLVFVAIALALVMWAVVRFGVAIATSTTLLAAMAMASGFALRLGAMGTIGAQLGVVELWGVLLLLTLVGLFVTALMAERSRARREIVEVGERYRVLFANAPHPLWVSERDGGGFLMVNERDVRTYGYSTAEFLRMRVGDLLVGPPLQLGSMVDAGGGYATARSRTRDGSIVDIELLSLAIELDDGPALLWFTRDVTEVNRLQRLAIEATDVERSRIAGELRAGLGRILSDLDAAFVTLKCASESGAAPAALAEPVADAARRAAAFCRQISYRVAPALADRWDLIDALRTLGERLPEALRSRVEVRVPEAAPPSLSDSRGRQLFELIREMSLQAATRGCDADIVIHLEVSPAAVVVTVDGRRSTTAPLTTSIRVPTLALRARSLGARLWERSDATGILQTCECPHRDAEAAVA